MKHFPFQLSVTLGSVETKTDKKGEKYTTARECTAHYKGGDRTITLMVFSPHRASVASALRKGKKIDVTAIYDKDSNNVVKILGPGKAYLAKKAA